MKLPQSRNCMSSEDYASIKDGKEKEDHKKILTMVNENHKHKLLYTTERKPFTISS